MILELKKPVTKAKVEQLSVKLSGAKSAKKPFNAAQYSGKIKWDSDALTIQKQMRDEWE